MSKCDFTIIGSKHNGEGFSVKHLGGHDEIGRYGKMEVYRGISMYAQHGQRKLESVMVTTTGPLGNTYYIPEGADTTITLSLHPPISVRVGHRTASGGKPWRRFTELELLTKR